MNQISLTGAPLGTPLYQEVKRMLMESMRDGEWKPGAMIPSERRLSERYGVSIGTIRKAVDELAAENILIRHQGRGTFVAAHGHDRYVFGFFHIVRQDGHKEYPKVEFVSLAAIKASAEIAGRLGLRPGTRVWHLVNRLSLSGKPVIIDDIYLPERLFPTLSEALLQQRQGTLYQLFQDHFGVAVLRTEERLRASAADALASEQLGIAHGSPLLKVIRVALTFRDQPVELRYSYVNTTAHEYFDDSSY